MKWISYQWVLFIICAGFGPIFAVSPTEQERRDRDRWISEKFEEASRQKLPFSFIFDGQPSSQLLPDWNVSRQSQQLDPARTEHTLIYTDPRTGLEVRWVVVIYQNFPTVEWTLHLKNTSASDSPILENIQALDTIFQRNADQNEFILHYNRGDYCTLDSYEPLTETLTANTTLRFSPPDGRPTNTQFPYYNIQNNDSGYIVVVSWPGQWASQFIRNEGTQLHILGGQELTRLTLHPGEEIRTPLIVMQFYQGDWIRAQNIWRRWMCRHNMPRHGGSKLTPILSSGITGFYVCYQCNQKDEILYFDCLCNENIKLDYWWIDAGWYPCGNWPDTGTWQVDTSRYPDGLRAVSDHLHLNDTRLIVWFEPERVKPETWLAKNHPEWIFPGAGLFDSMLLNLGDPQCLHWLIEHIDQLITEQGIDLYRQDFNFEPLAVWRNADAPDRQGITEIRHIEGYLAFWDELRRRHPDLLIDSCSSGGRRNDLETLRRSVPLLRSDYLMKPDGNQCHTYGLSFWLPFYGTGVILDQPYFHHSAMTPGLNLAVDILKEEKPDYDLLRQAARQWRQVTPYMLDDYYPLTPYSRNTSAWMAWQFDCPEKGEGIIQAFRRNESFYQAAALKLKALDPNAQYNLTNLDTSEEIRFTGRELIENGLTVTLKNQPDSAIFIYKRL